MWCCEEHSLDRGIGEHPLEALGEREIVRRTEVSRAFGIGLDGVRDPQPTTTLGGFNKASSPASQACDRTLDHEFIRNTLIGRGSHQD